MKKKYTRCVDVRMRASMRPSEKRNCTNQPSRQAPVTHAIHLLAAKSGMADGATTTLP